MRFPDQNALLGEFGVSHRTPQGEGSWKLARGFLQNSPHEPFPIVDLAWYPFTTINRNHEYNYMLSPMSLPNKSSNLGAVLGTLDTGAKTWSKG